MKRKCSSFLLAAALMISMSMPAFAANCRAEETFSGADTVIWLLRAACGGCAQEPARQRGAQALLRCLLTDAAGGESAQPEEPAQQDRPAQLTQPVEPAEPEQPAGLAEPEQSAQEPGEKSSFERTVILLVNAERAKYGLAKLEEDALLARTARMKSEDMRANSYFDHNSPNYGTPFQLMKSQGVSYRTAGENIAMGYSTPEAVVNAWMKSPGHRANILNASYTRIGVGYVSAGNYWTQHFIG